MVAYQCPTTREIVRTSIEATEQQLKRLGQVRLSVWCPHCHRGHQIVAENAIALPDAFEPVSLITAS